MKELDLHGLFHHQIRDAVENFIFLNSKELPLRIIVGNSTFIRNLTKNILEQYKYQYEIPAHNPGEVIVIFDNEF